MGILIIFYRKCQIYIHVTTPSFSKINKLEFMEEHISQSAIAIKLYFEVPSKLKKKNVIILVTTHLTMNFGIKLGRLNQMASLQGLSLHSTLDRRFCHQFTDFSIFLI